MKGISKTATILIISATLYLGFHYLYQNPIPLVNKQEHKDHLQAETDNDSDSPGARNQRLFYMLRDPQTNAIPKNARMRELQFARQLDAYNNRNILKMSRTASTAGYSWAQAGPWNIGGRTRALALDIANPNNIIAAGVSGGIWKSTDGGTSWTLRSKPDQNLSVTYVAQDPRSGHTRTWYYCTGEISGNSASGMNYEAFYLGSGVYESTDNGDTWNVIASTKPSNEVIYSSPFEMVSKIIVSPTTGSVFLASNLFGIYKMPAGGSSFSAVLAGQPNEHYFNDIAVNSNGMLLAALSQKYAGNYSTPSQKPGIYVSTDDGATWNNVTPSGFPSAYSRTVLAFSPSNPNVAYSFTYNGTSGTPPVSGGYGQDDVTFYKYTFNSDGTVSSTNNRSANMPNYKGKVGELNTQNNYNMVLAVKPDDPNFVILGATNLYRSTDGFSTSSNTSWIGGYNTTNNVSTYPNQHPDEHIAVFNPNSPNQLYVGSDGGVSFTSDATASVNTTNPVTWQSKNKGYVTTQYYAISIARAASDNRILGGMQDNGSPFYRISVLASPYTATDVSTGDGGYAYLGTSKAYASVQNGSVFRYHYDTSGNITPNTYEGDVKPSGASGQLTFVPFKIDPSNESTMYYPSGDTLWRNNSIDKTTFQTNWSIVPGIKPPPGYSITALGVSATNASNVLYVGVSDLSSGNTNVPRLYKITNSMNALYVADSTYTGFPAGAYMNDIAVNPNNSDEIMVVFSNYQVSSLYYSNDGGKNYTQVEGNLYDPYTNSKGQTTDLSPSFRSAAIVPTTSGTFYFAGTSTGLYMTTALSGSSTTWVKQDGVQGGIGDAVVTDLDSRSSDNILAVATHGRGAFIGNFSTDTAVNPGPQVPYQFKLAQNYPNPFNPSTNISYTIPSDARVTLTIYDVTGRKVAVLINGAVKSSGSHLYTFDASKLASGMYLYRLQVSPKSGSQASYTQTRKMILLK